MDVVRSQVDNDNDTTLPRGLSDLAQGGRERGVPCQRMMALRSGAWCRGLLWRWWYMG